MSQAASRDDNSGQAEADLLTKEGLVSGQSGLLAAGTKGEGHTGADLLSKKKPVVSKLTPKEVQALKLPAKGYSQKIRWDGGSGLGLRLNHEGKVWIIQARNPDGKSIRRTLGPAAGDGAISLADARIRARQARVGIERGDNLPALRKRQVSTSAVLSGDIVTFGKVREDFVATISDPGSAAFLKSWKSYKVLLHRPELAGWTDRSLAEIARDDVEVAFNAVVASIESRAKANLARRAQAGREVLPGELRHGAGVSANRFLSAISSLFEWASERRAGADKRLRGYNPALGWKTLRRQEADRERRIDLSDLPKIWKAFDAAPAPWPTVYRLCLLTIARRGEIQGMQWTDQRDMDGADARLELGSRTKAGRKLDRVVALVPTAAALLRAVDRHRGDYVFGVHKPLEDSSAIDAAVRKAAGLPYHWHVHGFRHVFATWALDKADAASDEVRGVLGQGITGALGKYAQRPPVPRMRALLKKWEAMLEELGCTL